jgi:hypothetical protein
MDFLRAIKVCSMPSFGRGVKPLARCHKILRHVKEHFKLRKRYFVRQNLSCHSPVHPALLLDDSIGRISRELWWTNQEFSPVNFIPPLFSIVIYHLGDEQYACWWRQFRDVISPHQHDRDHHHQDPLNA